MTTGKVALAASLIGLAKKQTSISHNLANIQSPAFKGKVGSFASLMHQAGQGRSLSIPIFTENSNFAQGDLVNTGNKLDVAINGKGFFKVQRPNGDTAFTRTGSLQIDHEGYLATSGGDRIMQETGEPIQVDPKHVSQLVIDERGQIKSRDIRGKRTITIGRLGLFNFVLPREQSGLARDRNLDKQVVPIGGGLYQAPNLPGVQVEEARMARVVHQSLEKSNVDAGRELIRMLMVNRTFQACSNTLRAISKAKNEFMALAKQG
jgi:flagellar basal body rod protein FlgG